MGQKRVYAGRERISNSLSLLKVIYQYIPSFIDHTLTLLKDKDIKNDDKQLEGVEPELFDFSDMSKIPENMNKLLEIRYMPNKRKTKVFK